MSAVARPMLAAKPDPEELDAVLRALRYPVIGSPKIDGIRCLLRDGRAVTRRFKPVPNEHVRRTIETWARDAFGAAGARAVVLDGELTLRQRGATFQQVSSAIMSRDGEPNFVYRLFDHVRSGLDEPYCQRAQALREIRPALPPWAKVLTVHLLKDWDALIDYEAKMLGLGHEGICVRDPLGPYKLGRSTVREQYLVAVKRFEDLEAEVVGFVEQRANTNAQTRDATGAAKRSHAQAGLVGKGALGALVVCDDAGRTFNLGTGKGLTTALRQEIWAHRDRYLGQRVKLRYQQTGTKDAPRIPSFLGFRGADDT